MLPSLVSEFLILTTSLPAGTGRVLTSFLYDREERRGEGGKEGRMAAYGDTIMV